MMRFFLAIMLIGALQSCVHKEDKAYVNAELITKIDSLRDEIRSIKNPVKKDSIVIVVKKDSVQQEKTKPSPVVRKDSTAKLSVKTSAVSTPKNITEKFYYKNSKRVSVTITPWINEKRTITLFDTLGKETYHFDDVRMSYSSTTEIKQFYPNGAVQQVHNHLNPGASMYWYETTITFDANNEPLSKTELQEPASLQDYRNGSYHWDKESKTWKNNNADKQQLPVIKKVK